MQLARMCGFIKNIDALNTIIIMKTVYIPAVKNGSNNWRDQGTKC